MIPYSPAVLTAVLPSTCDRPFSGRSYERIGKSQMMTFVVALRTVASPLRWRTQGGESGRLTISSLLSKSSGMLSGEVPESTNSAASTPSPAKPRGRVVREFPPPQAGICRSGPPLQFPIVVTLSPGQHPFVQFGHELANLCLELLVLFGKGLQAFLLRGNRKVFLRGRST